MKDLSTKSFGGAMMGGISMTSEAERLMREKGELMKAGFYTPDDPLMLDFDRQIRAA